MNQELLEQFKNAFKDLDRETQTGVIADLICLKKPLIFLLKCKPTADAVTDVLKALSELRIKSDPYREGNWVKFPFTDEVSRNLVVLSCAWAQTENK